MTTENAYDQMREHIIIVKEKHGLDAAKDIIKSAGGVDRMADIPEDRYTAVIAACKEKMHPTTTEEVHPLDMVDEPAPSSHIIIPEDALLVAHEAIAAIPEGDRTYRAALNAVWMAWQDGGFVEVI